MRKTDFIRLIDSNGFRELFVTHLGWNRCRGSSHLLPIVVDDKEYRFQAVAERSGLQVVVAEVDELPTNSIVRKIDNQLRRQAEDYISIYVRSDSQKHHLWVVPLKNVDKRDLVSLEYQDAAHADFLFSKIGDIEFSPFDALTIMDVKEAVHRAFFVNSEKITKDFYAGFKKQHSSFAKFITGIDDEIDLKNNRNKQWYASVMLNRLMFCYFIQKKGFLDGNPNYLRDKLQECIAERGKDQFFSTFYLRFLRRLFSDGLNHPKHDREFEQQFGQVPYLNGGMFDTHQIERDYEGIDISDDAFVSLFEFFDKWQWHLDTRVTASGRDINPDVLGYIFEQYINDRAQMGAYYTKEDITEYIGRNTILPFLFDKVAKVSEPMKAMFAPGGWVWQTLQASGNRYLFDAVKQGWTPDWRERIPESIAVGLDTEASGLLDRRARWNDRTPEPFALPTEIWRETIERLQRVDSIMEKISAGEITSINDFITYNLDIRLFASDIISKSESASLVYNFYEALRSVTVLDPTCGSGAFLFAAMNILEPLYFECIERMRNDFKDYPKVQTALEEIDLKYRSNIHYFIYKSIILRNLYGVDIMQEATEIAKLRLFLKMVAVVDVDYSAENLGLDPLPDIDFNIRCGNSLVGYANENSIWADHQQDMFARLEFEEKIKGEMSIVASTYKIFKQAQLTQTDNVDVFKQAKRDLNTRLSQLNETLNHHLHSATASGIPYSEWLASHKPFHWVAEFYQIIQGNGGFDVIIGNPPYVEYNKKDKDTGKAISDIYQLVGYLTLSCGNLYAFVMERSRQIISNGSYIGMIVPLSGHSTERMSPLVMNFYKKFSLRLHLNLSADAHPQKLFEGVKFRLGIFFVSNAHQGCYSTKYTRWFADERKNLFTSLVKYNNEQGYTYGNIIAKIPSPLYINIINKVLQDKEAFFLSDGKYICYYHNAPVNWIRAHSFTPYFFSERDGEGITTQLKSFGFNSENKSKTCMSIICSSLFFIWWLANSDCYHLNNPELVNFKYESPLKRGEI